MAEPGKGQAKDGSMRIDAKLVSELAQLLTDNELSEIEVADGDRANQGPARLCAGRGGRDRTAPPRAAPAATAGTAAAAAPAEAFPAKPSSRRWSAPPSCRPSPAPSRSSRSATPVKAGDTLLIIEAMKVMNPITAPERRAWSRQILVADAQPVEFDQPLVDHRLDRTCRSRSC